MNTGSFVFPAALVVGHPGHELRLFRWLEHAKPLVCVLTDGSGSGSSRINSSFDLLAATGCAAGPVMGRFTDAEIYDLMLRGEVSPLVEITERIAQSLFEHGIRSLVSDAFEFYNPTHDLCSIVAFLATARAEAMGGLPIALYDYAVTAAASGSGAFIDLSEEDVERKLRAAHQFQNLRNDVNDLLALVGRDELSREIVRPVSRPTTLPAPEDKPFYEMHGERRVASGRYQRVLRYEEHFVEFVRRLAAQLGVCPFAEYADAR